MGFRIPDFPAAMVSLFTGIFGGRLSPPQPARYNDKKWHRESL